MTDNEQQDGSATPSSEPGDPDAEPTQQFTQTPPYPSLDESSSYAGPSTPPPAAQPWLFGSPESTATLTVEQARPRNRGRRAGLVAGVAATALIVGGGAGFGGAALWSSTHDDDSTASSVLKTASTTKNAASTAPTGSVQAVAQDVLPSVVMIEVAGSQESGSGSGIILTADGTILTNNHVVEIAGDSGQIRVDFNDGTSATATVLGTDPLTDLAVIKAEGVSGLTPATLGNSGELAVGQSVVAIGSPYGLDQTVTTGVVSALNRPVNVSSDTSSSAQTVYPAIQTDAAINPGNSGGALVDMDGNVVGINASIRTAGSSLTDESGSIGLGFAIPIDYAKPIIEEIIDGQTPTHARIGISVSEVGATTSSDEAPEQQQPDQGDENDPWWNSFPGFGEQQQEPEQQQQGEAFATPGAQVQKVEDGSAGAKAGLKVGDVITKVDDNVIDSSDSLVATIRAYRPGDKVTVTFTRDGKEQTADVTLDSDAGTTQS